MKNCYFLLILCLVVPLFAQKTPFSCPSLDSILLPECNMEQLVAGKKTDTTCAIRKRMRPFIDYLKGKENPSCSTIVADVNKRLDFFRDTTTFKINTKNVQWIGDTNAPVTIVLYVSMMCPHCKQLYAQLYDTLQQRKKLASRIRIGLKNLSVTEYDHMFVAAAQLGKQPRFMRVFSQISERASDESMQRVADSIGITFDSLKALADQVTIARMVNSSREEALRNKVTSTPAIFINNRRYHSSKIIRWIIEATQD
jgi:glutaredoxin